MKLPGGSRALSGGRRAGQARNGIFQSVGALLDYIGHSWGERREGGVREGGRFEVMDLVSGSFAGEFNQNWRTEINDSTYRAQKWMPRPSGDLSLLTARRF